MDWDRDRDELQEREQRQDPRFRLRRDDPEDRPHRRIRRLRRPQQSLQCRRRPPGHRLQSNPRHQGQGLLWILPI